MLTRSPKYSNLDTENNLDPSNERHSLDAKNLESYSLDDISHGLNNTSMITRELSVISNIPNQVYKIPVQSLLNESNKNTPDYDLKLFEKFYIPTNTEKYQPSEIHNDFLNISPKTKNFMTNSDPDFDHEIKRYKSENSTKTSSSIINSNYDYRLKKNSKRHENNVISINSLLNDE
ncbi:hypothetical protein AYI70_g2868 [Smittium culicis]|uniref:Uncharacterized protein n=1 Tax=Smittium culicis TaxID=133412 RepID=A0A1R1Y6M7_9FUNG|nr:hypothetical protein AYI70_g2868 [Smittium culicis]